MKKEIKEEEKEEISKLRFEAKNKTLKRRAMIIYMKINSKLSNKEIAVSIGVSVDNVTDTVRGFNELGMKYLKTSNYKGTTSELDKYEDLIISNFESDPPKNIDEAIIRVRKLTGITRTANPLRRWLKKTPLSSSNPELFPVKRTKKPNKGFWIHSSSLY